MRNATLFLILLFAVNSSSAQTTGKLQKEKEVIVVFKTHFDIGYTDWAANVRHNYSNSMIEGALEVIEQSRELSEDLRFKWIISGWPMREMLTHSKPSVKPQIQDAVKNGQFVVHALPFTFETEACDMESMIRSLGYSSRINRSAGLPLPVDAKQTDVPSHSWILPTTLVNSGVNFLHIGCNPGSRAPELPLLFWWEGPDESRLMTMYFEPYYGTSPAPPDDWPFKTWLALVHSNDNTGAPTFEEYKRAIKEIQEKNPGAKVRTGSMSDFYRAIMAEDPQLPVIRGDMPDTWIHGYMSMPRETKMARKLGKDIFNLENLNTLLELWGGTPDQSLLGSTEKALEEILLFNEHTFGLAMSHGHGGYWAYGKNFESLRAQGFFDPIEFSWKEKSQYVSEADQIITPVLSRKMRELAESVEMEGERIVVHNPLPWNRSGLVTIQTNTDLKKALKNLATGEIIHFSKDHNIYRFNVTDMPAMGYTTLIPVDTPEPMDIENSTIDRENNGLENKYFRMTLDPYAGTIKSLLDKKTGKELVSNTTEWKFGQYVTERFSRTMTDKYAKDYIKSSWPEWAYAELGRINLSDEPYRRITGKNPVIDFVKDEISVSARVHFKPAEEFGHKYTVVYTLYRDKPYVEMIWSINGKPAEAWPEGGWVSFPFNIHKPQFKLGRPGAVVDPAVDFVKGSNRDYCFLNTGMAVLDEKQQGVGIMSPDVPGISLERPGLWKYSPDFIPKEGNVFFNLYNNQWSTNFTEWIEGSWSARFYIWSIDGYENAPSVVTPSEELRNPLMAALVSGEPGNLPISAQGVSLSGKGILLTTFAKNRDGEGDLIRLWEQNGKATTCMVSLPEGSTYKSAQPCNLRGEETGNPISIKNNSFEVKLNAYQPVSFILK